MTRNRNREAGDYFERRTRDALTDDGWVVVRAAGSLGVADLVALKVQHWPRLISCKVHGALPRKEALALMEAANQAGALPILAQREKPGWVSLVRIVPRFGTDKTDRIAVATLHMPARQTNAPRNDGLVPLGLQLELPLETREE